MFRVGLQYLDCRLAILLNQTPSWYFPENLPNSWNQSFFVTSSFVLKIEITLKITWIPCVRAGEEDDPLPILYLESEQNIYSIIDLEGPLSM